MYKYSFNTNYYQFIINLKIIKKLFDVTLLEGE